MTEPTAFSIERIAPSAESYLRRLPRHRQEAVAQAFDHLCNVSPFWHPNPTVIRPLKGKRKGQWRYRTGGIRIVYTVDRDSRTIRVVSIDSRGDVY
jgi:mRNA-degrading endonuclease RelE of RelBE toxin-antitoxin system